MTIANLLLASRDRAAGLTRSFKRALSRGLTVRPKKLLTGGGAVCAGLAVGALYPSPAQAWWAPGWGWHGGWGWRVGWGWRPGVVLGVPPVVVGAPLYAPVPYHRWVPAHYRPNGIFVPGHWAY